MRGRPSSVVCLAIAMTLSACGGGENAKTAADLLGDLEVGERGLRTPMKPLRGPYATLAEFCSKEGGGDGEAWRPCRGQAPLFGQTYGDAAIEGGVVSLQAMQVNAGGEYHTYLVMGPSEKLSARGAWYALGPVTELALNASYPRVEVMSVAHQDGQGPHDFTVRLFLVHEEGDVSRTTTREEMCRAAPGTPIVCFGFDVAYDVERRDGRESARHDVSYDRDVVILTAAKNSANELSKHVSAPGTYQLVTEPAPAP